MRIGNQIHILVGLIAYITLHGLQCDLERQEFAKLGLDTLMIKQLCGALEYFIHSYTKNTENNISSPESCNQKPCTDYFENYCTVKGFTDSEVLK